MSASVQGMEALMRRMKAAGEPKPLLRALQFSTIHEAQKLVHRKTAFLQRNIKPGELTDDHAIVVADTPYAAALEKGAKPHIIKPKSAKVLAWGGGRRLSGRLRTGESPMHFATIVHHPGNKPYPYLVPGAKEATKGVGDVIIAQWNGAA